MPSHRLRIDGETFRDAHNRQVTIHGINVAGDSKLPAQPDVPSHVRQHFFDGDDVSFVNRPFSLTQAHTHFARLRSWGFNTLRYIFTWEALEHTGPGQYDDEYVDFTIQTLRIAKEYGFYVFMDPHQDVWSRFTGGSGAPMWTIYACGFDPTHFLTTQASLVQNTWPQPEDFPKMIWATNYTRLAVQTIFTFFFSGRDFAPKCVIDGKNIQDYLQDHFVNACAHLAKRIRDAGDLEGECVIGYETLNEPNKGYYGHPDLSRIPTDQKLRKLTTPTGFQAMLTGSGRAVEEEVWDFGSFGPYKASTQLVDPNGASAWLNPAAWDDSKYGWKRSPEWKLGECVWAQHGIWDPSKDELLRPQYFATHPRTGKELNQDSWTNNNYMDFYRKYKHAIRSVWPEAFMLMQPSPFEIPPVVKGTEDGDDPNMIFASHFYDGITLITKKWNKLWNIDVLGVLRGKYSSPAFAIRIGESAIRNCFKEQLATVRQEGIDNMGVHPCLYTEIGIPYDMDEKHAYESGDYSSQTAAIDANCFAVEGSGAQGMTWWVYTATNSHFWGDNWNGEDLSIYSAEDLPLPPPRPLPSSPSSSDARDSSGKPTHDPSSPNYSASQIESPAAVTPDSLQKTLSVEDMSPSRSRIAGASSSNAPGHRAAEAYVRPVPVAVHGTIDTSGFDLTSCTYTLALTAPSPTPADAPTEIFLPDYHFPPVHQTATRVTATGGKWEIRTVDLAPGAAQQLLRWWHGEGEQKLTVVGVRRKRGQVGDEAPTSSRHADAEDSYLQAFWEVGKNCTVM